MRQRIDAAMRDFARTLPGQPLENQTARFELMEKIDQLQQENQQLKDQIAAMHPERGPGSGRPGSASAAPADTDSAPIVLRIPPLCPPAGRSGGA